jgi:hypothetical protein
VTPEEIEAMMRKAQAQDEVVIRDFEATYESTCTTCWEEIFPGDKAGYIDGDTEASCWDCCMKAKNG